ncbi:Uncharacterized protein dnm_091170 [Desulfonema magnum]|uniref:Uncharacterized protein n=1 Tax=Desulfonema magnum TaxID=45655 RepID=A0A975BX79_9BACT|nr:Uncharacterized protein dnm_091170 [Desulfonema magnum]
MKISGPPKGGLFLPDRWKQAGISRAVSKYRESLSYECFIAALREARHLPKTDSCFRRNDKLFIRIGSKT